NFGASLNARIHLDDAASIDVRGYYTHGHDGFDDNFVFVPPGSFVPADSAANNTNELSVGYAGFNLDLFGGMLHNRLAVMASASGRAFFDSSFDSIHLNSDNKGGAVRFEYQGIVDLGSDGQVTFGAETQQSN